MYGARCCAHLLGNLARSDVGKATADHKRQRGIKNCLAFFFLGQIAHNRVVSGNVRSELKAVDKKQESIEHVFKLNYCSTLWWQQF